MLCSPFFCQALHSPKPGGRIPEPLQSDQLPRGATGAKVSNFSGMDAPVTATTQARPRLWPLVVAIGVCVIFSVMFLGGGATRARSAVPHAAFLADTVTVTAPAPPPQTVTVTTTTASPVIISTDITSTKVINVTSSHTVTVQTVVAVSKVNVRNVTNTNQVTQINQLNSTAFLNVNVTNTSDVKRTVVNTQQLTKNVTSTAIVTGTASVTNTSVVQVQAVSKPKGLADRARLAIGAGGVAVTSAAGFGFLMLRRRGRYTA